MKLLAIAAMAATLPMAATGTVFAQSTGMMHGVQHAGAKARCSPGDPNVMVDQKNKTFVLDKSAKTTTSAKTTMMNPSGSMGDTAAAGAGAAGMHSTKTAMVSMCKSEALGMGAKMMSGGMHKSSM